MPTLAVVFDTNLYRGLSAPAFASLREREVAHAVRPIASYYVALEFLAHLADPEDPAQNIAFRSLQRFWERNKTYDGSREIVNLLQPMDNQLAVILFGRPVTTRDTASPFGSLVGDIVHGTLSDCLTHHGDQLKEIARFVTDAEATFLDAMWDAVLALVPDAANWSDVTQTTELRCAFLKQAAAGEGRKHIAAGFAQRAASQLGIELTQEELHAKADIVQEAFPLPVHFYDRIVRRIVEGGGDMSKKDRSNSLWDLQIAFSTGKGATIDGTPLWLISQDKDVITAAAAASTTANVKSLDEYNTLIDLPWTDYRAALMN